METLTMSYEELDRCGLIQRVLNKALRQREAAGGSDGRFIVKSA